MSWHFSAVHVSWKIKVILNRILSIPSTEKLELVFSPKLIYCPYFRRKISRRWVLIQGHRIYYATFDHTSVYRPISQEKNFWKLWKWLKIKILIRFQELSYFQVITPFFTKFNPSFHNHDRVFFLICKFVRFATVLEPE